MFATALFIALSGLDAGLNGAMTVTLLESTDQGKKVVFSKTLELEHEQQILSAPDNQFFESVIPSISNDSTRMIQVGTAPWVVYKPDQEGTPQFTLFLPFTAGDELPRIEQTEPVHLPRFVPDIEFSQSIYGSDGSEFTLRVILHD